VEADIFRNVAQSKIAKDPCATHQFDPIRTAQDCDFTLCRNILLT